jgi:tetratricopeptide (TPR) repeat protein
MNHLKSVARLTLASALGIVSTFSLATVTFIEPTPASAQIVMGEIHGIVKDTEGTPLNGGAEIRLSTDLTLPANERRWKYKAPVGPDGTYKVTGIAPGEYLINVFRGETSVDYFQTTIKQADEKTVDFDMSRPAYIASLTPEERKSLEEARAKNAGVRAENAKIANINKTIIQARIDEKNGKAADAVAALTPLTVAKPDEAIIWAALGEAQLAAADDARKAAQTAHTDTKDPAILQKYADAAVSYQKALDTNNASKKPIPDIAFSSNLNMGQAFGRSGKPDEAGAAYEAAAKADPTKAGLAYFNEAVVYYQTNTKMKEAAAAADRAIAADPKRVDAYYIKGQALIPDAKPVTDPKTQVTTFELPPGCLEAYQEYLELAPNGVHAADVKDLLTNLKQPIKSSFKAKK